MYTIKFDASTRTLHLELEGFWSVGTLTAFAAELLVKTTALNLRYGKFAILSDSTRFPVQSSAVSAGFERIRERGAQLHKGHTAVVVGSVLNKMQAERSLRGPHVRVFLSANDAKRWLAEVAHEAK